MACYGVSCFGGLREKRIPMLLVGVFAFGSFKVHSLLMRSTVGVMNVRAL